LPSALLCCWLGDSQVGQSACNTLAVPKMIELIEMMELPILVCAEKLENYFSLLHRKPRTKTDEESRNRKRSH